MNRILKLEVFSYSVFCNVSQSDLRLQGTHGIIGQKTCECISVGGSDEFCVLCVCVERNRRTILHIGDDPSVEF